MTLASRRRTRTPEPASEQSVHVPPLRTRPAWKLLEKHHQKLKSIHLRDLFAEDRERGEKLAIETTGIYLDYSKNRITAETLRLLLQLARECELQSRIAAMFRGDKINVSENRAVLHVALRAPRSALAQRIIPELKSATEPKLEHDSSTNTLIRRYRKLKGAA